MSSLAKNTSNEKRRVQNKIAQRKHRDKKRAHELRMAEEKQKLLSEVASLQARLEYGEATKDSHLKVGQTMVNVAPSEHVMGQ
jgi:hypothetical protein